MITATLFAAAAATASVATAVAPAAPASQQVVLEKKGATWSLPATITLPADRKGAPCVVFFAGSGPTDRDWTSPLLPAGTGSAKLLADALAAKGIGSIRFDKVGSGKNMKPLDVLSLAHYIDEARLAFDDMTARPACGKVFLLGHSEGSLHMTSAAVALQSNPRFGGLVSMSGPARSLLDTAAGQIRAMHLKQGEDASEIDPALAEFKKAMVAPNAEEPDLTAIPEAAQLWAIAHDPRQAKVARELMTADPLAPAKAYKGAALVLSGAKDVQVPKSDADALFAALASPASAKTETSIPNANHVYRAETRDPATTPAPELASAYTDPKVPLASGVVDAIAAFVTAHAK